MAVFTVDRVRICGYELSTCRRDIRINCGCSCRKTENPPTERVFLRTLLIFHVICCISFAQQWVKNGFFEQCGGRGETVYRKWTSDQSKIELWHSSWMPMKQMQFHAHEEPSDWTEGWWCSCGRKKVLDLVCVHGFYTLSATCRAHVTPCVKSKSKFSDIWAI